MFTFRKALSILEKEIGKVNPIGFWEKNNGYVFFIKTEEEFDTNYYMVFKNGSVEVTNPMLNDLELKDMKRI